MFVTLVYLCDVTTFVVAEENLRNGIPKKDINIIQRKYI